MLENNEKNILRYIKFFPILVVILFSIIVIITIIHQNKINYQNDINEIKTNFFNKEKSKVQNDVEKVYNMISFDKFNEELKFQNQIKLRLIDLLNKQNDIFMLNLSKQEKINELNNRLFHLFDISKDSGYFIINTDNSKCYGLEKNLTNCTKIIEKHFNFTNTGDEKFVRFELKGNDTLSYVKFYKDLNIVIGYRKSYTKFYIDLKDAILKKIEFFNSGKDNYLFIVDTNGKFLVHYLNDYINKNLINLKNSDNKLFIKDIINRAKHGAGIVEYRTVGEMYDIETNKVSFVKLFDDWNWVIGSGFHPIELEKEISNRFEKLDQTNTKIVTNIVSMIFVAVVVLIVFMIFFSNAIESIFKEYKNKNIRYQNNLKKFLNESKFELNNSLDTINNYISVSKTDTRGIITYVSDDFCKNIKYSREELIGNTHSMVKHPDISKEVFTKLWDTIKKGEIYTGTLKNLAKDGSEIWFEILIHSDYDFEHRHIGYTALRKNITDKKNIEKLNETLELRIIEEVEKSREKDSLLAQKDKMLALSEMLENIAHHWRQPLSVISTAASGIKIQQEYKMLDEKMLENYADQIILNSENLSKTLDNFRDFIKAKDETESMNLKELYQKIKNIIDTTFKDANIEFIENINDVEIFASKNEMLRLFINIFNNAKDALEKNIKNGRRLIFVDIYKDSNNLVIKIKDNAGGVPTDIINNIFEPYFTTKHKIAGNGMGLYLVNKFITNILLGEIKIKNQKYAYENENYKGAEFTIIVPLNDK